jgi:predicted adenine nucleotide alpha hydrolase (AANH) superfamily ATPase
VHPEDGQQRNVEHETEEEIRGANHGVPPGEERPREQRRDERGQKQQDRYRGNLSFPFGGYFGYLSPVGSPTGEAGFLVTLSGDMPNRTEALVHICCAPDATHGVRELRTRCVVTGFFYNPNIHPREEFRKRLQATLDLREKSPFSLRVGEGGEEAWEDAVQGMEDEPERGRRCEACVRMRLRETARKAVELGMHAFGTVLTVSPKKDAAMVNRVGREEGERAGIHFLEADLKKGDGYLKSVRITRELGLYRQRYCGCRYSFRP